MAATYKLAIQLVPQPLWGRNLRAQLSATAWKKLRAALLAQRGLVCDVCGATESDKKRVHAHEAWAYDVTVRPAVARVTGVELTCAKCHAVEHFGRLRLLEKNGEIDAKVLDDVAGHFCAVNQVDMRAFDAHEDDAIALWKARNAIAEWVVDWNGFADD